MALPFSFPFFPPPKPFSSVLVGMSGGVDSSVAALILKKSGWDVLGVFMNNWVEEEPSSSCRWGDDFRDVLRVCQKLDIPYLPVSFAEAYGKEVFQVFLDGLRQGLTPNPDILCNRQIKFHHLKALLKEMDITYLATGHYAHLEGKKLYRGLDASKDQSYFLSSVKQKDFENVLFPLGKLLKSQVRILAQEYDLPVYQKKDSVGLCFIEPGHFRKFLGKHLPFSKGYFSTLDGRILGENHGYPFYTLGQRRGLGIGGLHKNQQRWFVVGKDPEKNIVYVSSDFQEVQEKLYAKSCILQELNWIGEIPCQEFPWVSKVRHLQKDQACFWEDSGHRVCFQENQWSLTPGQHVVFYQKDRCLGGGAIKPAFEHNFPLSG